MRTITIGIDLAKQSFSACTLDGGGAVSQRRDLRREAIIVWLAQQPAGSTVAMEAGSGAHHWGRRCLEHGLVPKLMAAQFVTPFRKSRSGKNDRNDAEAIATAARQGNMRFVPVRPLTSKRAWPSTASADALVATIGDGRDFRNGRQLAAWLGLTPSQHSTGGKTKLGAITCRGDGYLRTLLIQGARSSLQRAKALLGCQAQEAGHSKPQRMLHRKRAATRLKQKPANQAGFRRVSLPRWR